MANSSNYPHPSSQAATKVMSANRRVDTKPEMSLRSALHRRGHRFFKDRRIDVGVTVRPDIVFPRKKVAVFVDGCFWHWCPQHGNVPGGPNASYWQEKLQRNVERDRRDDEALAGAGWVVVRVWEHQTLGSCVAQVEETLSRSADTSVARRPGLAGNGGAVRRPDSHKAEWGLEQPNLTSFRRESRCNS